MNAHGAGIKNIKFGQETLEASRLCCTFVCPPGLVVDSVFLGNVEASLCHLVRSWVDHHSNSLLYFYLFWKILKQS